MSIDFSQQRWQRINENYRLWWAGELERPLIQLMLTGRDSGRPEPDLPHYSFQSFYDLSVPAEAIIDRLDYELSRLEFLTAELNWSAISLSNLLISGILEFSL